ncbi:MAG: tetratricopeptide repeat protein [Bacteroidota bacterium]
MARRRNQKQQDDTLVDIVEARENAQDFFEANQNYILGGLLLLVLVIGGWFAYNNYYKAPRQKQAMEQMSQAQYQFERDSFALALENPGNGFDGFLDIIEKYSGTAAANTASYYAGISWLNLGEHKAAISYLEDFSTTDYALGITRLGALGDAHSELGEMDKAISYYNKAIKYGDNQLLTAIYIYKLGLLQMHMGKTEDAQSTFKKLIEKYPNSNQAKYAERYIAVQE